MTINKSILLLLLLLARAVPMSAAMQHPTAQPKKQPKTIKTKLASSAKLATDGSDPVCGMNVPKGTALTAMFGGRQYGFCSKQCQERFVKEPARYVKP